MSSKISLVSITLLVSFVSFGQTQIDFLKTFKPDSLPSCVTYSYDEQVYFGAIYHTDTIEGEAQDVFEKSESYQKDSSLLLTKEVVKHYLLPRSQFIYTIDGKSKDTLFKVPIDEYLNADFYAISLLHTTSSFYMVLYERVFAQGGIPSSEKFICSFTRDGKFISRALIASFVYRGTGYSASGARVPWFSDESACITNNMTIKFASRIHGEKKYKIQTDGKIVETN